MQDLYLMPGGSIQSVPAGSPPPAGGQLVGGPSFNGGSSSSTSTPTPGPTSTGIDASMISSAAASSSSSLSPFGTPLRSIKIPVWRDASLETLTPAGQTSDDRQAAEQQMRNTQNPPDDRQAAEQEMRAAKSSDQPFATPQMFSEKDAYNEFASIMTDPKKFKEVSDTLVKSGILNPGQAMDAVALQSKWNDLVRWAVDLKQLKGVDMTPLEVAQMWGQNSGAALLANQNFVRDHLTGTRIQNDQTIDEKTPSQTTLHDLLGRTPTQAELIAYNHGVEQTAAQNPLNRQIATHYTEGQPDAQTITYTGGYDQQAAEQQAAAAASPEVAQNQAATTYYNALVNALRAAA